MKLNQFQKVLHGCDSDVEWLQRDFSVYLVNVFDTHQVSPQIIEKLNLRTIQCESHCKSLFICKNSSRLVSYWNSHDCH